MSSARIIVERSIGLLKGRWRYLLDKLPMTKTNLIPYYIITCCILHNIYLLQNDRIEIPIVPEISHGMQPIGISNNLKEEGNIKRNGLMQIIANDDFERNN